MLPFLPDINIKLICVLSRKAWLCQEYSDLQFMAITK
jgi:hypothetical protein